MRLVLHSNPVVSRFAITLQHTHTSRFASEEIEIAERLVDSERACPVEGLVCVHHEEADVDVLLRKIKTVEPGLGIITIDRRIDLRGQRDMG